MVKYYIIALKYILGISLGFSVLFFVFKYIHNIGYDKAVKQCQEKINKYEAEVVQRIEGIEDKSRTIIEQTKSSREEAKLEFEKLERLARTKPVTQIKTIVQENGTTIHLCNPSTEFIETFNTAITRANKK